MSFFKTGDTFFDIVTKRDARALRKWWHWRYQLRIERSPANRRFYRLVVEHDWNGWVLSYGGRRTS